MPSRLPRVHPVRVISEQTPGCLLAQGKNMLCRNSGTINFNKYNKDNTQGGDWRLGFFHNLLLFREVKLINVISFVKTSCII